MRKFLVVLLCFSFIVTPVSSVQAQDKSEQKNEQKGGSKGGGNTSIAGYMNQVLGVSTAIIGTSILLKCKLGAKTPSNLAFFAGSLIYVASELMGAKAQKAFLTASKVEVEDVINNQKEGGGDAQKAIIEKKLKEEEEKLAFVNKRKTWMMAITAVFYAAMALAIAEHFQVWNMVDKCEGGSTFPLDSKMAYVWAGAYSFVSSYGSGNLITSLVAAVIGALLVHNSSFVPNMSLATTRAIAFGVAAVLATAITFMLNSEAKKIQENIKKLKELLAKFTKDTETDSGLTGGGVSSSGTAGSRGENDGKNSGMNSDSKIKPLNSGNLVSRNCWRNTSQGMEFSESACKNAFRVPKPKLDANLNLPTLQSVTESGADMAQAVADGNMDRADVLAGKLAANAARMKEVKDNLLKQLNDKLKAKGKKPLDMDKEISKRISQLEAGVNKNLASKGFGPLASIGHAGLGNQLPSKDLPVINPQDVGVKAPIVLENNKVSESVDEPLNEGGGVVEEKQASLSESLEGFETTEDDISNRSDDSIFQQLSTRYFLNYHRFFEKKKVEEGPPPPP